MKKKILVHGIKNVLFIYPIVGYVLYYDNTDTYIIIISYAHNFILNIIIVPIKQKLMKSCFIVHQIERVSGDNNYLPLRNSPSRDFDRFIGKLCLSSLALTHYTCTLRSLITYYYKTYV